ncbi:MAG: LutC/YkgG family protein [Rhodospirillales bacterium]
MSDARSGMLAAIAKANGPAKAAADILGEAQALVGEPDRLRMTFPGQSNLERFIEKATSERVTATVAQIASLADVPAEVGAYLEQSALPLRIALQPREALTTLDWGAIATHAEPAMNEPLAVSIADMAVAETGSVVFLSAPDAPILLNFLPLHHIVLVPEGLIYGHLEDVFTFVGAGADNQPRNLSIVTGTSGTADIEAKNIRGAHGPRFMHILIFKEG